MRIGNKDTTTAIWHFLLDLFPSVNLFLGHYDGAIWSSHFRPKNLSTPFFGRETILLLDDGWTLGYQLACN